MKLKSSLNILSLTLLFSGLAVAQADIPPRRPFLHPLFSDHAVLQRSLNTPVWGWSEPGSTVVLRFAGKTHTAKTGNDGRWQIKLKLSQSSAEPEALTVTNLTTRESAQADDVLVGDVWLCSGQSNMEMGVAACNATNDIAAANFPRIRLLTVPRLVATEPVTTLDCRWLPCQPDTVTQGLWGGFSAAGFFFGRELHRELNIPIGLIHSSWGGTIAEAWTSEEGLESMEDFKSAVAQMHSAARNEQATNYAARYDQWCREKDPGTRQGWESPETNSTWKTVTMPQAFEYSGLTNYDGMVWFRHEFDLPDNWFGKALVLALGSIDDIDTTWVNGTKVGQTHRFNLNRRYPIPPTALRPGRNVITIRVLDTGGLGGLTGPSALMKVAPAFAETSESIALTGEWQMCPSATLSQLAPVPPPPDISSPNRVAVLYNGMIAPLVPFAIKGAIWYQGESNADRASQYRRLLPTLIRDWRKQFGVGDFSFYIVQLAAFQTAASHPRDHVWAELREAQALTAATVRNCGLAVAIDVGDAKDIHPKNKLTVGYRLALCALAQTYGIKMEFSGPKYRSMKQTRAGIRLKFDHTSGGLSARGGKLTGFAIAGVDRKFVWADAVIKDNEVLVSSPEVSKPVAVRYGWDINSDCNLYNQVGLPAIPFRTDDWLNLTTMK